MPRSKKRPAAAKKLRRGKDEARRKGLKGRPGRTYYDPGRRPKPTSPAS